MRSLLFGAVAVTLLSTSPAVASACREKGKFVKCTAVKKTVATKCRANGKFAKCGTKGAKPI